MDAMRTFSCWPRWTAGSSGVALFGYPIRSITPASDSSHLSIGAISYCDHESPDRAEKVVKEIGDAGGKAESVGADLSTVEGTNKLIGSIDKAFGGAFGGKLDILANNAGSVVFGPFMEGAAGSILSESSANQAVTLIAVAEDEAAKGKPSKKIVVEALKTSRNVTEGAAGSPGARTITSVSDD